jgi:hypothetical protein
MKPPPKIMTWISSIVGADGVISSNRVRSTGMLSSGTCHVFSIAVGHESPLLGVRFRSETRADVDMMYLQIYIYIKDLFSACGD